MTKATPLLCGCDETRRGALIGDCFAALVAFPAGNPPVGITDSKKLSPARREQLAIEIRAVGIVGIGRSTAAEIDQINILQATMLAMQRAFQQLPAGHYRVLVDGNRAPDLGVETTTMVKGDLHSIEVGAASIIAKVAGDSYVAELDAQYPGYGLLSHKGYGTPEHIESIRRLGPTPHHRMSFAPLLQPTFQF